MDFLLFLHYGCVRLLSFSQCVLLKCVNKFDSLNVSSWIVRICFRSCKLELMRGICVKGRH